MPIGIVSDDEFLSELIQSGGTTRTSSQPNSIPSIPSDGPIVQTIEKPGRKEGDVNVPDSLRRIIGEEALLNGRSAAIQLAEGFGISPSSVSAYTKGATSTASYDKPKPSIIQHINKSRERAISKASKTLNGALNAITQEKLDYMDGDKLSGVAKDMSVIIKNLEPKQVSPDEGKQTPQFMIYAPQFRDERSFDTIVLKE